MNDSVRAALRRNRELAARLRRDGARDAAKRLVRRAARRLGADIDELGLLPGDVADSTTLRLRTPTRHLPAGTGATIGWICTPPAPGSGGHTTLFRMVAGLEARGHHCVLFLYDRHRGDFARHEATIRRHWPHLRARIRDASDGIVGVDAAVATSWECAHVLATRGTAPMRRLYFIQDYEPFFHPHGSLYTLAEDSYRFGFHCISLGGMIAGLLETELGVKADIVPFGCDTSTYRPLAGNRPRSGVVFFARSTVPRRGYLLGMLALEQFHQRHPEQEIHVYGDPLTDCAFPVTSHGRLTPAELNALYNRSIAGLALSFTNVTLVAEELLAAGAIAIANDSPLARAGLDNEQIVWAPPTPSGLSDALCAAVESRLRPDQSAAARPANWSSAQDAVAAIIEGEIYGTR